VTTSIIVKNFWSPAMIFPIQPCVGDLDGSGIDSGTMWPKQYLIHWFMHVEGKESMWIGF